MRAIYCTFGEYEAIKTADLAFGKFLVHFMQGWEFAHLLFRSKSLSLKSDKEQFALVALKKEQS